MNATKYAELDRAICDHIEHGNSHRYRPQLARVPLVAGAEAMTMLTR